MKVRVYPEGLSDHAGEYMLATGHTVEGAVEQWLIDSHGPSSSHAPRTMIAEPLDAEAGNLPGWWPADAPGQLPRRVFVCSPKVAVAWQISEPHEAAPWTPDEITAARIKLATAVRAHEQMMSRPMGCGHAFENLIGGADAVTKCGACVKDRSIVRKLFEDLEKEARALDMRALATACASAVGRSSGLSPRQAASELRDLLGTRALSRLSEALRARVEAMKTRG